MKAVLILFALLCVQVVWADEKATVPPPEEEETSGIPKRFTKEDLEYIKKIHEEFPNLHPDTFKIKETSFRKNHTEAEIAEMKQKYEAKKAAEKEAMRKYVEDHIAKNHHLVANMTLEEAEKIVAEGERLMKETKQHEDL